MGTVNGPDRHRAIKALKNFGRGVRRGWQIWSRGVRIFGTVLMFLVLTIIYWTIIPFIWLPMRIFSDPLTLKVGLRKWRKAEPRPEGLEWMRRQG